MPRAPALASSAPRNPSPRLDRGARGLPTKCSGRYTRAVGGEQGLSRTGLEGWTPFASVGVDLMRNHATEGKGDMKRIRYLALALVAIFALTAGLSAGVASAHKSKERLQGEYKIEKKKLAEREKEIASEEKAEEKCLATIEKEEEKYEAKEGGEHNAKEEKAEEKKVAKEEKGCAKIAKSIEKSEAKKEKEEEKIEKTEEEIEEEEEPGK